MKIEYDGRHRTDEVLRPIVKKALSGHMDAYETLVLIYEKLVYNICLRYSLSAEDSQDVTQEVFLKMWRSLPSFKWESSFNTWMFRIAQNSCLDHLRKLGREHTVSLTYEDDEDGAIKESELIDPAPEPSEQLERSEKIELLHKAIENLPPVWREVLILRDIEGYSYAQISDMLGIEEGTLKSRLHRARDALKEMLSGIGIFE